MPLNIKPTNQRDRALIFIKTLLNNTDLVTKVADHSILNGVAEGVAKLAGKAEKDIILALSVLFPDTAYSTALDIAADTFGIAPRFGASESSTYLRLVADSGTTYLANTNIFNSKDGVQFQLEEDTMVGDFGYTYAKVRSIDSGEKTNVSPGSINSVSPQPVGHKYVINEYIALYGRDAEDDTIFRHRIKNGSNVLAKSTIALLEQIFMKINNNVLRVIYHGINDASQIKLAIVTQNGIDLTQSELDEILDRGSEFFGFSQLKPFGSQSYGIILNNIQWHPVDISLRADLFQNAIVDDVRREMQIRIAKNLDFRFWNSFKQKVEWDDLLQICKTVKGVKYVPDEFFFPHVDIKIPKNKLPRLRGFLLLDLDGNIISGSTGTFNPAFFPQQADFSFQQTVLASI